jgi:hypothetical protein
MRLGTGIPLPTVLNIANAAASQESKFSKNAVMDPTFTSLRAVNVFDFTLGFELFSSGRISSDQTQ